MVLAHELADPVECGKGLWRARIKGGAVTVAGRYGGVLRHSWWKMKSLGYCWWEERKAGGCAPSVRNTMVEPETRQVGVGCSNGSVSWSWGALAQNRGGEPDGEPGCRKAPHWTRVSLFSEGKTNCYCEPERGSISCV